MTVQLDATGPPGGGAYASNKFSVTVNGSPTFVYGFRRNSEFYQAALWAAGEAVEVSCFTYGADEPTTVVISPFDGGVPPFTSVALYSVDQSIVASVSNGAITLTIVGRWPVCVECNGDAANVLYIHPHGLKSTPPGGYVTYNGTQVSVPAGTCLYFPAGVHDLVNAGAWNDIKFPIYSNATVYIEHGALVRGTFSVTPGDVMSTGVQIRGPGILCGDFIENEAVPANFDDGIHYAMLYSILNATNLPSGNHVSEVTIARGPYHSMVDTVANSHTDVHVYSPWCNNSDGPRMSGDPNSSNVATMLRCSVWVGDDAVVLPNYLRHLRVVECLFSSSYSAALQFGYRTYDIDYGWTTTLTNNVVRSVSSYYIAPDLDDEGGATIQCWVDESRGANPGNGRFRVTVSGLRVEGQRLWSPLINIKNKPYPWVEPGYPANDQRGNIANFVFEDVTVQSPPTVRSILSGFNASNTPNGFVFRNVVIGGVKVGARNHEDYIDISEVVYNVTFDGVSV